MLVIINISRFIVITTNLPLAYFTTVLSANRQLLDMGLSQQPTHMTYLLIKYYPLPFQKVKRRTVSSTSSDGGMTSGVSKMAAFLPGGALWRWCGPVYRRTAKPRLKKLFYKAIQRGEEVINVSSFLSFMRP